jgi:hypothetical protein
LRGFALPRSCGRTWCDASGGSKRQIRQYAF